MKSKILPILLSLNAVLMLGILVRPVLTPQHVVAQSHGDYDVFVEPGTRMLRAPDGQRQVYGKVMVDLRSGRIWGFPTLTPEPYPIDGTSNKPPVSHPFLLGTFDLAGMDGGGQNN